MVMFVPYNLEQNLKSMNTNDFLGNHPSQYIKKTAIISKPYRFSKENHTVSARSRGLLAAAAAGMLDERDAVLEALLCMRRAGSDLILTYYATQAARWLNEGGLDRSQGGH